MMFSTMHLPHQSVLSSPLPLPTATHLIHRRKNLDQLAWRHYAHSVMILSTNGVLQSTRGRRIPVNSIVCAIYIGIAVITIQRINCIVLDFFMQSSGPTVMWLESKINCCHYYIKCYLLQFMIEVTLWLWCMWSWISNRTILYRIFDIGICVAVEETHASLRIWIPNIYDVMLKF